MRSALSPMRRPRGSCPNISRTAPAAERFGRVPGSFNTGTARHRFCRHCGIKSFYVPRSHPDGVSVNLRCVEEGTVRSVDRRTFDGRNWERHYPKGRAESFPN